MKELVRRWFSIKASDDEAEISILDEIGGFGVSVSDFKREIDTIKNRPKLLLLINSPGGGVFDGIAMYNILAPFKEKLTVKIVGTAASIASVVALAGSKLIMGKGTYLMIHEPWSRVAGTADDMRKAAELMDSVREQIISIYAERSVLSREILAEMLKAETWFSSAEAIEAGFADEEIEQMVAALGYGFDRFGYRNVPGSVAALAKQENRPPRTKRDLERVLRESGFSRAEALVVVAKGFDGLQREAEVESGSDEKPVIPANETDAAIQRTLLRLV